MFAWKNDWKTATDVAYTHSTQFEWMMNSCDDVCMAFFDSRASPLTQLCKANPFWFRRTIPPCKFFSVSYSLFIEFCNPIWYSALFCIYFHTPIQFWHEHVFYSSYTKYLKYYSACITYNRSFLSGICSNGMKYIFRQTYCIRQLILATSVNYMRRTKRKH